MSLPDDYGYWTPWGALPIVRFAPDTMTLVIGEQRAYVDVDGVPLSTRPCSLGSHPPEAIVTTGLGFAMQPWVVVDVCTFCFHAVGGPRWEA